MRLTMPIKPKRLCNHPGCNQFVAIGYCEQHKPNNKLSHALYKRNRTDHKEEAFYSSLTWRKMRKAKLTMQPLCEQCQQEGRLTAATIVHHIEELKQRPELGLQIDNLMSVCDGCHNKIHKKN